MILLMLPVVYGAIIDDHLETWQLNGTALGATGTINGIDTNINFINGKSDQGFGSAGAATRRFVNISEVAALNFGDDNFSYCFWYNHSGTTGGNPFLIDHGGFAAGGWGTWAFDTGPFDVARSSQGNICRVDSAPLATNQYYHICTVYNGTHKLQYTNGSLSDFTTCVVNTNTQVLGLTIGRANTDSAQLDGDIDEVSIWNKILNASDILKIFTEELFYNFAEGPPPPPNAPPTQDVPILNSTDNPFNSTLANLTLFNQSTADVDGDNVRNIIDWRIDDFSIAQLNYPFEGGSDGVQTKDYTTNNDDGVVTEAIFNSSGGFDGGGAYQFDGINDMITTTDDPDFTESGFTFSAWINHRTNGDEQIVFGSHANYNFGLRASDKLILRLGGSTIGVDRVNGIGSIIPNTWNHIAATYSTVDGLNTTTLFINGVVDIVVNLSGPDTDFPVALFIGVRNVPVSKAFNGSIDEVLVFNRTLTQEQIFAIYNNKSNIIVSEENNVGESWTGCITPNDGIQDGNENCSNSILINAFPTVNILFPTPPHTENNTVTTIHFNLSGISVTCNLLANGTIVNSTIAVDNANTTLTDDTSDIFFSETINYSVSCMTGTINLTDSILINIDRDNPIINFTLPLNGDVFNSSFDFNITCEDPNLLEFEGQIIDNNGSGSVVQSFSFVNISNSSVSFTDAFTGTANFYEAVINCSDGHTQNNIDDLFVSQNGMDIAYSYDGNWITEEWRSSSESVKSLSYIREDDRVITYQEFDRDRVSLVDAWITKRVYCSEAFKIVPNSAYDNHVVCGQMWYDTVSDARSTVSWIDDYTFDVTYTTKEPNFYTRSVGIINTNQQNIFFTFDNESPVIDFLTLNNTVFSLGNNNIEFNVSDLHDDLSCTLEEDRNGDGIFEVQTTSPSSIVNGVTSFITTILPNTNTSFEYKINCFDPATNKGVSTTQTLSIISVGPYELGLNSFFVNDFDVDTIAGILFFILLIGLWILLIWLADKWLNPALFAAAFIWGIVLGIIIMFRVSQSFGIVFTILQFIVVLRLWNVDSEALRRNQNE